MSANFFFLASPKDMFIDFREKGEGRETEIEISIGCLFYQATGHQICAWACVLTGMNCYFLVHRTVLQSIKPPSQGTSTNFL